MSDNPLDYAKEHEKQKMATRSDKMIRALFWGNRVGKTEWGGLEAARYIIGKHPFKQIQVPNEGWVCCPSFDLQVESTQNKLGKYLAKIQIEKIECLRGNIWKNVYLKNGSKITFKSYEQGAEKFQSAGKRWIWFDEEPPSDIYEECLMRQEAGVPLEIWITMTPVNGMTWIYDEIYCDPGNKLYFISEAEWNDNPYLTEDQKNIMRSTLEKRGERIEVREKGRFLSRVGLVCNWWRREKHLKKYDIFSKDWAYYEVFDGGWTDPATWLLIGIDGIGDVHVVDGFAKKEQLTEELVEIRNSRVIGISLRGGIADNDNPRLNRELSDKGMVLRSINKLPNESKSWDETMAEAIASYGQVQKGTGVPRLYINENLKWLISQIENLKWLESKKGDGVQVLPRWDDHRKYGHHFDGIYCLGYFFVDYQNINNNFDESDFPHVELFDRDGLY
jgi:phage terminase large subunit-like protein